MGTQLLSGATCSCERVDRSRSVEHAQRALGFEAYQTARPRGREHNARANRAASRFAQSVSSRPGERAAPRTWWRTATGRFHCVALAWASGTQLAKMNSTYGSEVTGKTIGVVQTDR